MLSCEYCGIFKITCFEENLIMAASIRRYFDTINLMQSGFCTTYSFKILISERKYKNKSQKLSISKRTFTIIIYIMFYYKIPWFCQDFKSENLWFLNLYSVHAARILDLSLEIMLSPPK